MLYFNRKAGKIGFHIINNEPFSKEKTVVRIFILLIAGIALSGCASMDNTVWVPESISKTSLSAYGTVFGSIGKGGNNRSVTSRSLHYRAVGQKDTGEFRFNNGGLFNSPVDFSEGAMQGSVFFVHLPPGDYEIFNVSFFENRGYFGTTTFSSKQDFSIRFAVKEGHAVYLGEFLGHLVLGKNFLGIPVTAGGYFVVANKLRRDLAVLSTRGEKIAPDKVTNMVPTFLSAGLTEFRDSSSE